MTVLVTGAAGFIGYHLCCRLLERGDTVVGLDSLNNYYDPGLKRARLERIGHVAASMGGRSRRPGGPVCPASAPPGGESGGSGWGAVFD